MESLIIVLFAIIIAVVIMRFLGAWMLRINEILQNQRELISEIQELRKDIYRGKKSY